MLLNHKDYEGMARTKGAVNTSTMIKAIRDAGRYTPGLENEPRERIKAVYESVERNAGVVPVPKDVAVSAKSSLTPLQASPKCDTTESKAAVKVTPPREEPQTEFGKRFEAARQAARAHQARMRELASTWPKIEPPMPKDSIVDTTLVAGRTVAEWYSYVEERKKSAPRDAHGAYALDLTDLPDWVTWALEQWAKLKRPTVKGKAQDEIKVLLAKAKDNEESAASEEVEANKDTDKKRASKRREQADKKRAKAVEYRKQAEAIANQHSIKIF